MTKPGPKPKPRAAKASKGVTVMFTPGEVRALREAAGNEPLSGWIRARVLSHLAGQPEGAEILERLDNLERQVRDLKNQIQES